MASSRPVHVRDGNFQLFQIHHDRLIRVTDPTWLVAGVELHQQVLSETQKWPLPLSKAATHLIPGQSPGPSVEPGVLYSHTPPVYRSFPTRQAQTRIQNISAVSAITAHIHDKP